MKTLARDTNKQGMLLSDAVKELWPEHPDPLKLIRSGQLTVNKKIVRDQNFVLLGECKISWIQGGFPKPWIYSALLTVI